MKKILHISASQFSGTTLVSFLLNVHPEITTVGHSTGWEISDPKEFYCSCGDSIAECPMFQAIRVRFQESGREFDFHNFGTRYELTRNPRLNQLLTQNIPGVHNSPVEHLRDRLVYLTPWTRKKLKQQHQANGLLMGAALDFSGASVYLDNSHDPYRIRHISCLEEYSFYNLHVIRDPRGFALSAKKNSGWNVTTAIQAWLRRQGDIVRIASEIENSLILYYEDICTATDETLARVHHFLGLNPQKYQGNFKEGEHHILGNRMRLSGGQIRPDTRWQDGLSENDKTTLRKTALKHIDSKKGRNLRSIVQRYFA